MNNQILRNTTLVFLCLLLSASCSREEPEYPLQGHWLQVEHLMEYDNLDMLDITDSTTLYYWKKFYPPKEVTLVYKDTVYLPRYHLQYSPRWKLDKDLLTVYDEDDSLDSIVYTRIRDNRFWKEEYFNPLLVSIEFENWSADYDLSRAEITIERPFGDLFLGYSKDRDLPDQIYIQTNDVYIGLDGIQQWLSTQRDMSSEKNRAKLKVLVHADKQLPYSEVDKVLEALKKEKEPYKVYRAGLSEQIQDLVYRKLTNTSAIFFWTCPFYYPDACYMTYESNHH